MRTIEVVLYREGAVWVAQASQRGLSHHSATRAKKRGRLYKRRWSYTLRIAPDAEVTEVADVEVESVSLGTV